MKIFFITTAILSIILIIVSIIENDAITFAISTFVMLVSVLLYALYSPLLIEEKE